MYNTQIADGYVRPLPIRHTRRDAEAVLPVSVHGLWLMNLLAQMRKGLMLTLLVLAVLLVISPLLLAAETAVEPPVSASISGRVVDAVSGNPIQGNAPPFARVDLFRCFDAVSCFEFISSQSANSTGRFQFDSSSALPLEAGTYQLTASSDTHFQLQTAPFSLGEGEDRDVGDLALNLIPAIGSISGRLIDAFGGNPLQGNAPPFARVELFRCSDAVNCFEFTGSQSADNLGRFQFVSGFFGTLMPGMYQISGNSDEHQASRSAPFSVGEGENRDVGDVALTSRFPVRFSEIRPCGDLPPEGGVCRYSVRVTNQSVTPIQGAAWSLVEHSSFGGPGSGQPTRFQANFPRKLELASGESAVVRFKFTVPSTVADGTSLCTHVLVGQGSVDFYFNPLRQANLFCISKGFTGGFAVLSEKKSQALFKQMRGQVVPVPSTK